MHTMQLMRAPRAGRRLACTPAADYWSAVTDVPCPCGGTIRWAEAGYVPGYRICDGCGRHYRAEGDAGAPTLRALARRDRRSAADREAQARLRQREEERHTMWVLLYAAQHALQPIDPATGRRPGQWPGWVTGDDLPALREAERRVQDLTDTVNIAPAGETRPGYGMDLAACVAESRRLAHPEAWAIYLRLRAVLPMCRIVEVSPDATQVYLYADDPMAVQRGPAHLVWQAASERRPWTEIEPLVAALEGAKS